MIPVFGFLLTIISSAATIATLTWVFYRTRVWAAIANIAYLSVKWLFLERLLSRTINEIQTNEVLPWFGAIPGERASNFLYLIRFIFNSIETALFIWLLLALVRRTRRT